MKIKVVGSLLGPLCILLFTQLPSEGRPQASGSAGKDSPQATVDTACQQAVNQQAFCANPASGIDRTQLCSYLPPDSPPQVGYTAFTCPGQVQFDNYSWQALVALNWPANPQGQPCTTPSPGCPYTSITAAPISAPRVWDYFIPVDQVFPASSGLRGGRYPGAPTCGTRAAAKGAPPVRVLRMMSKSDGNDVPDIIEPFTKVPLIDRNLNFTVYEILLNQDETNYILTNRLNTVAGQEAAAVINFPCGKLPGSKSSTDCPGPIGGVGSIEIKTAWRILDPAKGDDPNRYFWREQDLYIPADRSADHTAFCIPRAKLGLVGIHILHKAQSQPQWFWTTFEHQDNAPPTTSTTSCVGPGGSTIFSYYQPQCPPSVCKPNAQPPVPAGGFLWQRNPPYALPYATAGRFGTQVVRCQPVEKNSPSSPLVDARWQAKLQGTVWQFYRLTGTQWGFGYTGAPPVPPPCYGKNVDCAPPFLLDAVLETYMQPLVSSTNAKDFHNGCIQCHALATTVGTNPKPADFSFLLGRAQPGAARAVPAHAH
jgi:hypothetical protein